MIADAIDSRSRHQQHDTMDATQTKKSRKRTSHAATATDSPSATKLALGPYPNHSHPTAAEVRAVHDGLSALHPEVCEQKLAAKKDDEGGCGSRKLVLDALVGTILSQNTTDVNSHRAFLALKTAFPTWASVRAAPNAAVEDAIRQGGLAATKTVRIKAILDTLMAERGELSLEHLREVPDAEVKVELKRFKGVGAKTISCVLLFCLGRADFPVDTHVWKIALALGWVPKAADRDGTYEHLNLRVPDEIKYSLHVLLVEHGKQYKNDVAVLRKMAREVSVVSAEAEAMALEREREVVVKSEPEVKAETPRVPKREVRVKREVA